MPPRTRTAQDDETAAQSGDEQPQATASVPESGAAAHHHEPVPAAPLQAPDDGTRARPGVAGVAHQSTSSVAAAAGQRSLAGEGHLGLVDEDGNALDAADVFDEGDGTTTFVTTTRRVYEKFVQPGTRTPIVRLVFPANARVPRDKADGFRRAASAAAENPLTEAPGRERLNQGGQAAEGQGKGSRSRSRKDDGADN